MNKNQLEADRNGQKPLFRPRGEEEEEDSEESSLVQTCRLRGLLPANAERGARERDRRGVEGGGEKDQSELEGSGDWRVESGQAAGEARPQRRREGGRKW